MKKTVLFHFSYRRLAIVNFLFLPLFTFNKFYILLTKCFDRHCHRVSTEKIDFTKINSQHFLIFFFLLLFFFSNYQLLFWFIQSGEIWYAVLKIHYIPKWILLGLYGYHYHFIRNVRETRTSDNISAKGRNNNWPFVC